ncbi:MAG: hypothetical protein IJU98_05985 [Synergistaceae bacterium]|nr:hypothetical protein [Synergistaceae bacterium]
MQTEKIEIHNGGLGGELATQEGLNRALEETERFAESLGLDRKGRFHLRLLAEEMLGMARAIVGEFSAEFWLEWRDSLFRWSNSGDCILHLEAAADVNYPQRRELLSVSTEGRNIAPRGIMEKVRELVEAGLYGMEESLKFQTEYGAGILDYGTMGMADYGMSQVLYSWSMQKYRDAVTKSKARDGAAAEAWDELEKSIVAKIANEVRVGVRKGGVELVVVKEFNR